MLAAHCVHKEGSELDQKSSQLMDEFRQTGSEIAYEQLFAINQTLLTRFITQRLRFLSIPVDASDILQEAFFNIYRYPHRFRWDNNHSFRAWTGAIISNVIRRHLRRKRNFGEVLVTDTEFPLTEVSDPQPDPAYWAMDKELQTNFCSTYTLFLQLYWLAFQKLSGRDKKILELVEVRGLRYREVAKCIGTRPDNVKMYVFRARQKVLRIIGFVLGDRK